MLLNKRRGFRKARRFFGERIVLSDGREAVCNVVALLKDTRTGKEWFILGSNIVTNDGDQYYAEAAVGSPSWAVAGVRLGTNAGTPTAPAKTDVKMQTTTGSTPFATKAIDATYPKTNDADTDNTGAGVDVATWRISFTTGEANSANIATLDLPDSLTDVSITKSLAVANFTAKFEKTSSDTLKVFVNHTFNGV